MNIPEAQSIIARLLERNRDKQDTFHGVLNERDVTGLTVAITLLGQYDNASREVKRAAGRFK